MKKNLRRASLLFLMILITGVYTHAQAKESNEISYYEPVYSKPYTVGCSTLTELNAEDGKATLCTAGWAGNEYDIWVVFETDGITSKPYFIGKSMFDIFIDSFIQSNETSEIVEKITSFVQKKFSNDFSPATAIELWFKAGERDIWDSVDVKAKAINASTFMLQFNICIEEPGDLVDCNGKTKRSKKKKDEQTELKEITLTGDVELYYSEIKLDTDADGLTDFLEMKYGTQIDNPDTDKDGVIDVNDTNPLTSRFIESDACSIFNEVFMHETDGKSHHRVYSVKYPGNGNCSLNNSSYLVFNSNQRKNPSTGFYGYSVYGSATFYEIKFKDVETAVVIAEFWYGPLATHKTEYTLKREDGSWRVVKADQIWIS